VLGDVHVEHATAFEREHEEHVQPRRTSRSAP
jgi:hypothetical protein